MERKVTNPFIEQRRANRVNWERPVRIVQPLELEGKVIDASAVGLLLRVDRRPELHKGDWVTIEIPRADGEVVFSREARIVRLDIEGSEMLLGLELI